jgi:hypothetical protein
MARIVNHLGWTFATVVIRMVALPLPVVTAGAIIGLGGSLGYLVSGGQVEATAVGGILALIAAIPVAGTLAEKLDWANR